MERYELTFTIIARIFQIHQHWTTQKRILLLLDGRFLDKQNIVEVEYTRGRHNNCDMIYIAQNYFQHHVMFPQGLKNLTHTHTEHCARDSHHSEFKRFCHGVWSSEKHNFVTVDLTSMPMNGKYRHNLNQLYFPTSTI